MDSEFGHQRNGYSPANESAAAPEIYGGSASEHTTSRHEFTPPDERKKGRWRGRRKNYAMAATCAAALTLTLAVLPVISGQQTPITPPGPTSPTPYVTTSPQPTPMSTPAATDTPTTPAETGPTIQNNRMYFIRSASFLVGSVFFEKPETISFAMISIWAPKENYRLFDHFIEQSELADGRYDLPEQTGDDIFAQMQAGKFGDSFNFMKTDLEMRAEIQYINGDSKTLTCKAESQMWYGMALNTDSVEFFHLDGSSHTLLIDRPEQVRPGVYSMTVLIDDRKVAAEDMRLDKKISPAEIWDEATGKWKKGTFDSTFIRLRIPSGSRSVTFIVVCWLSDYETALDYTYTFNLE